MSMVRPPVVSRMTTAKARAKTDGADGTSLQEREDKRTDCTGRRRRTTGTGGDGQRLVNIMDRLSWCFVRVRTWHACGMQKYGQDATVDR